MKVNLGKIVPQKGVDYFDGKDGIGIKKIEIKDDNLIITLTDNKKINLGKVVGKDGKNGSSGRNGRDATINGANTLTIEAGDNISIEQEDDKLTISSTASDLSDYVSYSTQSKTTSQQNQARKNIGIPNACVLYNQNQILTEKNKHVARKNIDAKKAIKYLGEIDLSQYNDDVFEFISTLTSEGEYKFVDSLDGFTWLVNVVWLGDYLVGQSYCYSEEGFEYIYYRSGYYDENNDTYRWNDWISFLTSLQGQQLFAFKNHVHYNNVNIAYTIRTYLDSLNTNADYRITSNLDKEMYIVSCYYYNVSVNGTMQYRRSQRYFSISEPWKVYSRFGLYNTSTKKITWNAWHVVEGVEE